MAKKKVRANSTGSSKRNAVDDDTDQADTANKEETIDPMEIDNNDNNDTTTPTIETSVQATSLLDPKNLEPKNSLFISNVLSDPLRKDLIELLSPPAPPNGSGKEDTTAAANDGSDPTANGVSKVPKSLYSPELITSRSDRYEIRVRNIILQKIQGTIREQKNGTTVSKETNTISNIPSPAMIALCTFWLEFLSLTEHLLYYQKRQEINTKNKVATSSTPDTAASKTDSTGYKSQNHDIISHDYSLLHTNTICKLPMLLLEDILDVLSIQDSILFWKIGIRDALDLVFGGTAWKESSSAWLPFLKVGNKFWKRLTSPSEPTGESDDATVSSSSMTKTSITAAAADVMWVLSTVYPLSEKSAVRPWGNYNTDHETAIDKEEDHLLIQQDDDDDNGDATSTIKSTTAAAGGATESTSSSALSYSFYSKFWLLHQDLRSPNKLVSVGDFIQRLRFVLPALENHPITIDSSLITQTVTPNADFTYSGNDTVPICYMPFLKHSRIFPIQLRDPVLRVQFVTQFMFVAHHLLYTMPTIGQQVQTLQPIATKLVQEATDFILSSNNKVDKRSSNVVGWSYLNIISSILQQSETQWRTWKHTQKCSPAVILEDRSEQYNKSKTMAMKETSSRKRKRPVTDSVYNDDATAYRTVSRQDIIQISQNMASKVPSSSYEEYFEEYVEALDPEAGIDKEYHPKYNTNYTWQALRLLSSLPNDDMFVPNFQYVEPSGDFENLIRHVYKKYKNVDIPGEGPEHYIYDSNVDNEESKTENNDPDNTVDNDADHIETGTSTPMETEEQPTVEVNAVIQEEDSKTEKMDEDEKQPEADGEEKDDHDSLFDGGSNETVVENQVDQDNNKIDSEPGTRNRINSVDDNKQDNAVTSATIEKDNYRSEGETEEHQDEDEEIVETRAKSPEPVINKEDTKPSRNNNDKVSKAPNDRSNASREMTTNHRKGRDKEPSTQATAVSTTSSKSNERGMSRNNNNERDNLPRQVVPYNVGNSSNRNSGSNRSDNIVVGDSRDSNTSWNRGVANDNALARDHDNRDYHQQRGIQQRQQQQGGTNAGTSIGNPNERRNQDRPYRSDSAPTDARRGGDRGGIDSGTIETNRRGNQQQDAYLDDRRGGGGDRGDRRDRDHHPRGGGGGSGKMDHASDRGPQQRRGGGMENSTANNSNNPRSTDERGGARRGRDDSNSYSTGGGGGEDWRRSERGPRRGGGGGGGAGGGRY